MEAIHLEAPGSRLCDCQHPSQSSWMWKLIYLPLYSTLPSNGIKYLFGNTFSLYECNLNGLSRFFSCGKNAINSTNVPYKGKPTLYQDQLWSYVSTHSPPGHFKLQGLIWATLMRLPCVEERDICCTEVKEKFKAEQTFTKRLKYHLITLFRCTAEDPYARSKTHVSWSSYFSVPSSSPSLCMHLFYPSLLCFAICACLSLNLFCSSGLPSLILSDEDPCCTPHPHPLPTTAWRDVC